MGDVNKCSQEDKTENVEDIIMMGADQLEITAYAREYHKESGENCNNMEVDDEELQTDESANRKEHRPMADTRHLHRESRVIGGKASRSKKPAKMGLKMTKSIRHYLNTASR